MDKNTIFTMLKIVFTNLEEIKQKNQENTELAKKIIHLQEHITKFHNGYKFSDDETKESMKIACEIRADIDKQYANSMEEKLQIDKSLENTKFFIDNIRFSQ